MKRTFLLSVLLATSALASASSAVKESDLPDLFRKESPYIQNRVCAELLASMSRMSADLYSATRKQALYDAAVMSGTRSMVFVKANAQLNNQERLRAKRIAGQIESSASPNSPVIVPYTYCEERFQRWVNEGVVTPKIVLETEREVRSALATVVVPDVKTLK